MVPHLSCPILIRWDCSILHLVLVIRDSGGPSSTLDQALSGQETKEKWAVLSLGPGELAQLTQNDPTLQHTCTAASCSTEPQWQGPCFSWQAGLLYCQEGDLSHCGSGYWWYLSRCGSGYCSWHMKFPWLGIKPRSYLSGFLQADCNGPGLRLHGENVENVGQIG